MTFYTDEELRTIGLASVGQNVRLSRLASLHGASRISIGDHSRIDDFCVLSAGDGGISIGRNVHIAVFCSLIGRGRIEIRDFVGLSGRTSIYSSTDDFSGEFLTGPTIPPTLTNMDHKPVTIGRHAIVGAVSVILPGTELRDGVALGALSLAKGVLEEFTIYVGSPAVRKKARSRRLLELERDLHADEQVNWVANETTGRPQRLIK